MINKYGVPVDCSHPAKYFIASFDTESAAEPTEAEWRAIRSYIEYTCLAGIYRRSYGEQILSRPEPLDSGHNTVTFHKRADGNWGYRRATWTMGPTFWPQPASGDYAGYGNDGKPMDLPELLDHINTIASEPLESWVRWRDEHSELAPRKRQNDGE